MQECGKEQIPHSSLENSWSAVLTVHKHQPAVQPFLYLKYITLDQPQVCQQADSLSPHSLTPNVILNVQICHT